MPRHPRLDFPGIPQHIVQRGNDRKACFAGELDYLRYRQDLGDAATRSECAIHAYVMMTNHVHLLVTPAAAGAASEMMQALGRRYVGYFNTRYRRTGTLWEGRFKACLVDSERYLLTCYRYVELNPVRARMVTAPESYRWSSYSCNAMGADDWLVTPHAAYLALGKTRETRCSAYADLVAQGLSDSQAQEVKQYLHQQRALGSEGFQEQIRALSGRTVVVRPRGGQPRVTR
jgi:putative transposase